MKTKVLFIVVLAFSITFSLSHSALAQADVEAKVRTYFADIPVMAAIAKCESGFRQFGNDGTVLRGGDGSAMIGVFQFFESAHLSAAQALGFDIHTLDGNLAYARHLYGQQGTDPWISAFECWSKGENSASLGNGSSSSATSGNTSSGLSVSANFNLSFGMVNPEVLTLQQNLNRAGFAVAPSGPGSPGNETTKFGSLTRAAVRRFQCDQKIACSGDEFTTGYGLVDSRTQTALAAIVAKSGGAPPITSATDPTTTSPVQNTTSATNAENAAEIEKLKALIAKLTEQVALLTKQLAAEVARQSVSLR